jgi:Tfp pilus assembly protein PilO
MNQENNKNLGKRYSGYLNQIKEKTKTEKGRSFLWLSISLFTITFFMVVVIKPTLTTIANLTREIKEKKELNKKMQVKIDSILKAQNEYAKNSDNFYLLDEALPEKNEFPRVAMYFEQIALDTNIVLSEFSFNNIGEKDTLKKKSPIPSTVSSLKFSLTAEGDYQNLKKFIEDIESSRRIPFMEIVSFNLNKKDNINILRISLSGNFFYTETIK